MININFDPKIVSYNKETKTFSINEKNVQFAIEYTATNPETGKSKLFVFTHSTGPEFDPSTKWIYRNNEGLILEVCNDPTMVKIAAKSYYDAKCPIIRAY